MGSTFLVSVLVVALVGVSSQAPCRDGGCGEVTVYLGPRWGSKVIRYSNYSRSKAPSEWEASGTAEPVQYQGSEENDIPLAPRHQAYRRPILPSSGVVIDDTLDYYDHPTAVNVVTPTRDFRWRTYVYGDINSLVDMHTLNLSGLGTTGDELKIRLSLLNDTVTPMVKTLYLERNNIRSLPVLTFPVWMEYGLLELRLDDNPLTYLSTYTRFEISRLAKLKVLSLAKTGLLYMDSLYLPNLETLILSNNRLTSVPMGISGLQNLRRLYLDGNNIHEVFSGSPLADLHHLWLMSLADNRITNIWAKNLYQINTLNMTNNSLESLYDVQESGVRAVYLDGNLLQCSCPLVDAVRTNQPQIIVDRHELTCILRGERVLAMSLSHKDVQLGCPGKWGWLKAKSSDVANYLRDEVLPRHLRFSTIFTFLGWLSILVGIFLVIKSLRKSKNTQGTNLPPYNILDDKNVI